MTRRNEALGVLNTDETIVIMVDEAHRSQTSTLHANLMAALPNAAKIGFTGTPIMREGKKRTDAIFGAVHRQVHDPPGRGRRRRRPNLL